MPGQQRASNRACDSILAQQHQHPRKLLRISSLAATAKRSRDQPFLLFSFESLGIMGSQATQDTLTITHPPPPHTTLTHSRDDMRPHQAEKNDGANRRQPLGVSGRENSGKPSQNAAVCVGEQRITAVCVCCCGGAVFGKVSRARAWGVRERHQQIAAGWCSMLLWLFLRKCGLCVWHWESPSFVSIEVPSQAMLRSFCSKPLSSSARITCLLLLLFFCLHEASARNSSGRNNNNNGRRYSTYVGDREFRQRKIDCASSECAGKVGADEMNCTYKCMSQGCFSEIYGHDEIEEGEIDTARSRLFNTCFKRFMRDEEAAKAAAARVGIASHI